MYKDKEKNREYHREYNKKWRAENKDKLTSYRGKQTPEQRDAWRRRYEENNGDKVKATKKQWWAGTSRIYYTAKARAKKQGVPFTVSREYVISITPDTCPVLGIPLERGGDNKENSPSLDKVIPALGYVPGNVVVISNRANRLKSDATVTELRQLADFYETFIERSTAISLS